MVSAMKAITIEAQGAAPAPSDQPTPALADDSVLVRVRASSANPVDNAIAAGMLAGMVEHDFPITLGRDYAGVVEQVGPAATGFSPGDAVFGFLVHADPAVHAGSWAELLTVPADRSIAPMPGSDFAAAGAAPLAGITALAAVDALALAGGATVLVVGATGGVGGFAVQLAAAAGATVLAPGLPEDETYLRDLGVTEVLDRAGDVVAAVRERHPGGIDGVLDVVSYTPDGFEAHATVLSPGGRGASPLSAAGDGPGRTNVMAVPSRENLDRLAGLLADGSLRVPIQATYELDQAPDALQALAGRHTQGKRAIHVS
jgi:NADPH2:quinone reductase